MCCTAAYDKQNSFGASRKPPVTPVVLRACRGVVNRPGWERVLRPMLDIPCDGRGPAHIFACSRRGCEGVGRSPPFSFHNSMSSVDGRRPQFSLITAAVVQPTSSAGAAAARESVAPCATDTLVGRSAGETSWQVWRQGRHRQGRRHRLCRRNIMASPAAT